MSNKKGNVNNARRLYRQQVLSGFEHLYQPKDEDGNSSQDEQGRAEELPPKFWQSKAHQISIKLIVEKVGVSGDEHKFRVRLNDDADILVSTYAKQSKRVSKEVATIPGKGNSKTVSISMVYGVQQTGQRSLSPVDGYTLPEAIAQLYSFLLVNLDRTIERIILQQENTTANDDTGKRVQGDEPPKKLGSNKAKGRRRKVLPEVRDEALSEVPAELVETYGEILGERLSDIENRLDTVGNDTNNGG